jgi:integrase
MRLCWYRGAWYAYVRRGKRVSLRTDKRDIAEQRLKDLQNSTRQKPTTVKEVVEAYKEANKHKPSHRTMVSSWKSAESFFANYRPDQIDRDICQKYADRRRQQGISNETIRHEIGVVRSAIRWDNPKTSAVFELPPAPPPRERYLTRAEVKKLLDACKLPHLKLFVILAVTTAARKTAILQLTWDRVDFEKRIIRLAKGDQTGKGRATVPMNETAYRALKRAKEGALTDYVVEYGAKPVLNIIRGFMSACKAAGLKNVTPHDLRRTAAVWMAEKGSSMSEIASYLGHTTTNITFKVYAKYSPDHLQKPASALEIEDS